MLQADGKVIIAGSAERNATRTLFESDEKANGSDRLVVTTLKAVGSNAADSLFARQASGAAGQPTPREVGVQWRMSICSAVEVVIHGLVQYRVRPLARAGRCRETIAHNVSFRLSA